MNGEWSIVKPSKALLAASIFIISGIIHPSLRNEAISLNDNQQNALFF